MTKQSQQNGFTLVEVMIAVFVFAIGMLGLAGLQLKSYQSTSMAHTRTSATLLASSLAERMRSNLNGVTANSYNLATVPVSTAPGTQDPTCTASGCGSNQMALNDIFEWATEVNNALPGATVAVCIDSVPEFVPVGAPGANIVCDAVGNEWVIYIDWLDRVRIDNPNQTITKRFTFSFVP